jgi:hypothetical protein
MAMLTNAYETQMVQSLGVRIGPSSPVATEPSASEASAGRCPFGGMVAAGETPRADGERANGTDAAEQLPVRWTAAAEARLGNVPAFVRPMARAGIEKFARDNGSLEVDEKILDAAREFFGM